jgi:dynein assembly factor 3, axonemal
VGRSVSARGLWCDILSGPFHSFGTLCDNPKYYQRTNKEFKYTALDISEHNILALHQELHSGGSQLADVQPVRRAQAARGPTDMKVRNLTF